jgi:hypothetical protein
VLVAPSEAGLSGSDGSDSLFTIQASISLLDFQAAPPVNGTGALLTWGTKPGPESLAGYHLERAPAGGADWRTLVNGTRETSYLDEDGGPGARYRLGAINGLGEEYVLGEVTFGPVAPLAAWPLPYRGGDLAIWFATVSGFGGGTGSAEVTLHDVSGRRVRTLASGSYPAGYQRAVWDGRDDSGRPAASGVYFLRLATGGRSETLKLTVLR